MKKWNWRNSQTKSKFIWKKPFDYINFWQAYQNTSVIKIKRCNYSLGMIEGEILLTYMFCVRIKRHFNHRHISAINWICLPQFDLTLSDMTLHVLEQIQYFIYLFEVFTFDLLLDICKDTLKQKIKQKYSIMFQKIYYCHYLNFCNEI